MQDSTLPTNGGQGTVNQAKLKKLVDSWGSLPERERSRMLQDLVQGLSPTHREAIENYFRNLARSAAARRP